ncbi:peroxiredoxin [Kitasatospora sp. MAP12-15]|uniref:TlpA disulfide reductase family protein n=1 Tax=unclassified Kitasatospora TaxID=2633591 RepID=UPI0024767A5E|nr:TlpA disulfide reductase family protein [Kitasatospora sp. MAP12-44]MDH6110285.1 peroxiredoxin [Kitasatospora sp. MAP12-44]
MSGQKRLPVAAVLMLAGALTFTGCSPSGSGSSSDAGFIKGSAGVDTVPLAARKAAPAIAGNDLNGKPIALSDYQGKIVVINLWGSWCSGCRAEADGLEQAYEKYQGQGVQFLGINTRDTDPTNALRFEQTHGITYPSLYDPDGTQILRFPKGSFDPQFLPTTLVVDRHGRLAARALQAVSTDQIEALVTPILAERN